MSGTKEGGQKAAETNRQKYGKDFYSKIGAKGGKNSCCGGFASDKVGADGLTGHERSRVCGQKAGIIGKRGCRFLGVENGMAKYLRKSTGEIFECQLPEGFNQ